MQERPRFRDQKIAARDPHPGAEELSAQAPPGQFGQLLGDGPGVHAEFLAEELGDLLLGHVEGGGGDVRGLLPCELDDELAQVRLVGADSCGLQGVVEPDLLRHHALGLDDAPDAVPGGDLQDDPVGLPGVGGPVDAAPGGGYLLLQQGEIAIQVGQAMEAKIVAGLSEPLPALLAEGLDDTGAYAAGRARAFPRRRYDFRRGVSGVGAKIDPSRRFFHNPPP